LATIYVSQGKYEQAEILYQECLHLCEQHSSSKPLDLAASLNNLGELYHEQGKYAQAESLYLRTLQIWEQHQGSAHTYVAFVLTGLAILHSHQGKYAEAERCIYVPWDLEQRLGLSIST
jgi:tetratricopeptide (TPR) repeat protein